MKPLVDTKLRDRMAYDLAQEYLLRFASAGVTKDLLRHYLVPPSNRDTPNTMADVFKRLLESAQNRGMMATVIGRSIGGVKALDPLLVGFSPKVVVERFAAPEDLLDAIKTGLKPVVGSDGDGEASGPSLQGRHYLAPVFLVSSLPVRSSSSG